LNYLKEKLRNDFKEKKHCCYIQLFAPGETLKKKPHNCNYEEEEEENRVHFVTPVI